MSDWKTEKEKFLAMSLEEKRKVYFKPRYYTVKEIPTWKEYFMISKKLPEPIPLLPSNKIESSLNSKLADKVSFFTGDITTLETDAIVNAANKGLGGGAGVDGAIHRAADWDLLQGECLALNGCAEGEAKLTGGYKLPAKYVIHTVGPQGEKPGLLQLCYRNSIQLMLSQKLRTIAFPCISTGVYRYPLQPAAHVAVMEVRKQLEKHYNEIDRVIFYWANALVIAENRKDIEEKLWDGLKDNIIDMVVSDHSPCTPELKLLDEGDFIEAWGGISSLQFGLLLFWTEGSSRGLRIFDIKKYLCEMPAALTGLHTRKGKIAKNYDADFVIWNPNGTTVIHESIIQHKNKVTPYIGRHLKGNIIKTIVRGEIVYEENKPFSVPTGKLLVNEDV
ncbi:hypothetical protein Trydic_g10988 [Trypoxylus dichotomus]